MVALLGGESRLPLAGDLRLQGNKTKTRSQPPEGPRAAQLHAEGTHPRVGARKLGATHRRPRGAWGSRATPTPSLGGEGGEYRPRPPLGPRTFAT
jgi:hypothetical protein